MAWVNEELASMFREIAELLELTDASRFRIRAYERAADAITAAQADLSAVARSELDSFSGIGASTAEKIAEYLDTGSISMLTELREEVPPGVRELTRVPGLGPKTALQIHAELGVDSVEELSAAIENRAIRQLKGLGVKTEQNLADAIRRMGAKDTDRQPFAVAVGVAEELCDRLGTVDAVAQVAYAGSVRRVSETVGDIDILVATTAPAEVTDAFVNAPLVTKVVASGDTKTSVIAARGLQVDLRVVDPDDWGAALVYFTGSKSHNVRLRERALRHGLTVNEYGVHQRTEEGDVGERIAGASEAEVYAALDLAEIAPAMREDRGEIEAAAKGELPQVVTVEDMRGDLHGHSDWSGDGKASLEDMVAGAARKGYDYWAATDHAEDLTMNGITKEQMLQRREQINALAEQYQMVILDGAELNIGIDGTVDYDWDFLLTFDWCVASVHTLMTRPQAEQTERIMTAMQHPAVHAIGHPTGRKIGKRPGYEIDFDAICDAAVETGTALEINASPARLDLGSDLVQRAVNKGVTFTISCDAHSVGDLNGMRFGVATAQKGWAEPGHVLNTRDLDGLRQMTAAKRERFA